MEQQTEVGVPQGSALRARLQHWREDAQGALSAVRQDYEHFRKVMHDFGEHSQFRAFLNDRRKADEKTH